MCGNVCLQTRMDTQETQKRFLKASTLEFSFLLVEGTLAMNSLLKKKKKKNEREDSLQTTFSALPPLFFRNGGFSVFSSFTR